MPVVQHLDHAIIEAFKFAMESGGPMSRSIFCVHWSASAEVWTAAVRTKPTISS